MVFEVHSKFYKRVIFKLLHNTCLSNISFLNQAKKMHLLFLGDFWCFLFRAQNKDAHKKANIREKLLSMR